MFRLRPENAGRSSTENVGVARRVSPGRALCVELYGGKNFVLYFGRNPLTLHGAFRAGFVAKLWIPLDEAKLLKLPPQAAARASA
jgi:hypothetical protein